MGTIFISYRRADSMSVSGRIYDNLMARFGEENVFKDVYSIHPGDDWPTVLDQALANCGVMLVIIGPGWLKAQDEAGYRRLDGDGDFVRREIETALARNIKIIPVLVQGAVVPPVDHLPPSIKRLAYRQPILVRDDPDFRPDMDRLIAALPASIVPAPANEATISHDADDFDNLISAGLALCEAGHYAQAIPFFERATRLNPRNAAAWDHLAGAYHSAGRLEEALDAYHKSAALNPYNPKPLQCIAQILSDLGRYEDALAIYNRELAIAPTEVAWAEKAQLLRTMGRTADAEEAELRARTLGFAPTAVALAPLPPRGGPRPQRT